MPPSYIVPVKNYFQELTVDSNNDVLLLSAVDHILQYCNLYFQDSAGQNRVRAYLWTPSEFGFFQCAIFSWVKLCVIPNGESVGRSSRLSAAFSKNPVWNSSGFQIVLQGNNLKTQLQNVCFDTRPVISWGKNLYSVLFSCQGGLSQEKLIHHHSKKYLKKEQIVPYCHIF